MNGYQIIDFQNVNVSGSGATISGVHAKIADTDKPTLVTGLYNGSVYFKPTYAHFTLSGTSYVATIASKTVTVTNADKVTISA